MKSIILTLFLIAFVSQGQSQYTRVIVQLTNKGGNTYSLSNPSQFLSAKAIQRRTRYSIALDSTDLPVTQNYINAVNTIGNVKVLSVSKWLNRVLVKITDPNAVAQIQALPFVESVNYVAPRLAGIGQEHKFREEIKPLTNASKGQQTTSDTFSYGYNYNQVHIHEGEFLHNKGFTGSAIQITMLDAGFRDYRTITAFDSIRMNGQVLGEKDFVDFDDSGNEDDTHGMYCLSTMAANWPGQMVGTAPKARYWLVRTENAPTEYPVEEFNWVVGAEFADSTGSDLISSSLGYNTFDDALFNHSYNDFYKNKATSTKGAALAAKKGMIVMNSAGNEGSNVWRYIIFPADADSVCAVGAINNQGIIAGFSSRGYAGKVKPNIVSVGVNTVIAGLNSTPSYGNGTSFANPNIAGLVACLWQAFPALNNMQILDAVYRSANQYTSPDSAYGFGIPNFRKAYRLIRHDQNVAMYGNEWLWANPDPFDTVINARFIGRRDGGAVLNLKNAAGQVLHTQSFAAEEEEVYNLTFSNLGSLPAGYYTVEYTDSITSRSITLQKGAILALNFLSFKGEIIGNIPQLRWTAEHEMRVTHYELQRSADVTSFSTLAVVNPVYGVLQNTYSYIDNAPLNDGFYRLKIRDIDSSFAYSDIVELKLQANPISIKYNGVNALLSIAASVSGSEKLQVSIFSVDGKKIMQQLRNLNAGNNEFTFSLISLPKGVYVVNATSASGNLTLQIRR